VPINITLHTSAGMLPGQPSSSISQYYITNKFPGQPSIQSVNIILQTGPLANPLSQYYTTHKSPSEVSPPAQSINIAVSKLHTSACMLPGPPSSSPPLAV